VSFATLSSCFRRSRCLGKEISVVGEKAKAGDYDRSLERLMKYR